MRIRIASSSIALVLVVAAACGNPEDEAKKLAEAEAQELIKRQVGDQTVVTTKVPVEGSKRIPCDELFDPAKFTEYLGEKEPVVLRELSRRDRVKRQPGMNAICEFLRAGERPSREEQQKMAEKTMRLGVLPGDPICEVRVDCSRPQPKDFEATCRERQTGHRDLGVFACTWISQRAERDAFRYKLYEPDTDCFLDILGGPSVTGDEVPRACAKAALETMSFKSIEAYKN